MRSFSPWRNERANTGGATSGRKRLPGRYAWPKRLDAWCMLRHVDEVDDPPPSLPLLPSLSPSSFPFLYESIGEDLHTRPEHMHRATETDVCDFLVRNRGSNGSALSPLIRYLSRDSSRKPSRLISCLFNFSIFLSEYVVGV